MFPVVCLKPCNHDWRVGVANAAVDLPAPRPPAKSPRLTFFSAAALAFLVTGCIYIPSKSGTGRVLVVGIGLVSVNDRTNQAITATSTHVLGLGVSNRPGLQFGFGYASGTVTTVSDGAKDVRAEISQCPFGPLTVSVQSATLISPTNHTQKTQ